MSSLLLPYDTIIKAHEGDPIATVSYTHLDVYKRQRLSKAANAVFLMTYEWGYVGHYHADNDETQKKTQSISLSLIHISYSLQHRKKQK